MHRGVWDKVCMRILSMIFFHDLGTRFSSALTSCTDEKSNNPLDVIIPPHVLQQIAKFFSNGFAPSSIM